MKRCEVRLERAPGAALRVGILAEDRGRVYFEYAPEFLETGLNLSPFRLPFESGLFEYVDRGFGPLPGLFDDSLPDGWGLLLMDRHFRWRGLDPVAISPLERLAWLGGGTMGALTYHPPAPRESGQAGAFDLYELSRQSQEILVGAAVDVLPQLLRAGGSPGGARPKVLVGLNPATGGLISGEADLPLGYEGWIVKFPGKADASDAGAVEYAYSMMARSAGIELPPTRLFETREGGRFFGVKRFDREGGRRLHVHTFGNLIESNFRIPSADYADLLKAASVLTRDHRDVCKALRLMVFNVLAHNRDDHVKNFSFILDGEAKQWRLAPAYDLSCAVGPGGEHTMTLDGEGKAPGQAQMMSLAKKAGLSKKEAQGIIDEVRSAVAGWKAFASRAGVPRPKIASVAGKLAKS